MVVKKVKTGIQIARGRFPFSFLSFLNNLPFGSIYYFHSNIKFRDHYRIKAKRFIIQILRSLIFGSFVDKPAER